MLILNTVNHNFNSNLQWNLQFHLTLGGSVVILDTYNCLNIEECRILNSRGSIFLWLIPSLDCPLLQKIIIICSTKIFKKNKNPSKSGTQLTNHPLSLSCSLHFYDSSFLFLSDFIVRRTYYYSITKKYIIVIL